MVNGVRYRLVKNLVKQICETLDVDRVDMAASSGAGSLEVAGKVVAVYVDEPAGARRSGSPTPRPLGCALPTICLGQRGQRRPRRRMSTTQGRRWRQVRTTAWSCCAKAAARHGGVVATDGGQLVGNQLARGISETTRVLRTPDMVRKSLRGQRWVLASGRRTR
jgi:hypothetical protein